MKSYGIKRLAIMILVAILLAGGASVLPAEQVSAAESSSKAKLDVSKLTLYKGDKYELSVESLPKGAKVKYSTSDKTIATVSKDGVIKGKAKGNATITVKITEKNGKTYKLKCKITVKKAPKKTDAKEKNEVPENDVPDAVTEFEGNGFKYSPGVRVTNNDDLYNAFMDALYNLETNIEIKGTKAHYEQVKSNCATWAKGIYTAIGYGFKSYGGDYTIKFTIDYEPSFMVMRAGADPALISKLPDDMKEYLDEIDGILANIIKPNMTRKEKITAVHDFMVESYEYDYSFSDESYTFYGLLKNKKGVCQGYATLFYVFMTGLGIRCDKVTGYAASTAFGDDLEPHMWNSVVVNGETLYVDVTYDDGSNGHDFLLKNEKDFYGNGYHKAE